MLRCVHQMKNAPLCGDRTRSHDSLWRTAAPETAKPRVLNVFIFMFYISGFFAFLHGSFNFCDTICTLPSPVMAEPTKRSLTEASATDFVNSTHTLGRSVDGGSGDSSHRASSSGGSTAKSSEQSAAVTKLSKFMRGGKKGVRLRHFSASSPGKKKYMEDRVDCRSHRDLAPLIRGLAAKNRFCHFAVFDGHGGANTVEFAQSKLARNIAIQVRQLKHKFSKDEIKSAIKHGFAATDKAVAEQVCSQFVTPV